MALWLACLLQFPMAMAQEGEPILPLSLPTTLDVRKVALGRELFHDTRLSKDLSISCASCHPLANAGMDGQSRSIGVGGARGMINAPTVFNAGLALAQFWDGRAADLEQQVEGPIHNPLEMASKWDEVLSRLNQDSHYSERFQAIYASQATAGSVSDAIGQFERSLVTVDAPFDRWLRGEESAIDAQAKEGYALFKSYGCVACHQGAAVGGNLFQRMGAMGDYFDDRKAPLTPADFGRFNVTDREEDRFYFKVPSLRLVGRTAPYFHDGSAETLAEAIRIMARYQLGRPIADAHVESITVFLKSLAGRHPELAP